MPLTPEQARRFGRHLSLGEVGAAGQERLCAASLHVAGGERAAEEAHVYLAAAGVKIVQAPVPEDDNVDLLAAGAQESPAPHSHR